MKRLALALSALAVLTIFPQSTHALIGDYYTKVANETGLAYNKTYDVDLGTSGIDSVSMQAVYSTYTVAAVSFTDGQTSTGSITVVSTTSLIATQGQDTITISNNSGISATQGSNAVDISSNGTSALNGSTLTVVGVKLVGNVDWTVGASSNATATSIAAAIAGRLSNVTASVSGGTVTITCVNAGVFCSSYTLTSSTQAAMVVQTSSFTGGVDNAIIRVNGYSMTQGTDWLAGGAASATAVNIMNAINNNIPVAGFTASTPTSTTVNIKCATSGMFCNTYTLTTSTNALSVTTAKFTGGVDNAFIAINGVTLTQGTDWTAVATTTGDAKAISDAIIANTSLSSIVTSSWTTGSVVYATSTAPGAAVNYTMYSSTPVALKLSNQTSSGTYMTGGSASNIVTATSVIKKTSHGLSTALAVLYAKSAGTSPGQLVAGTTYYPVIIDANNFQLSSTSTGAVAGTGIVAITTQTVNGGGTFTLTALPYAGTPTLVWQGSNDGVNYNNVSIASVTYSVPLSTPTSTLWDFGKPSYRHLMLNVTSPTTGGLAITVTGYGKSSR